MSTAAPHASEIRADYEAFLAQKAQFGADDGFEPLWLPSSLKPFQESLVAWRLRKGRALVAADCGLGKTLMQLVAGENVVHHTNRPVLIPAPLAVAGQTVREAQKFGIDCVRTNGGSPKGAKVHVTNYEKLHLFDADDWGGVECDESSILKAFDGERRAQITEFLRKRPYRGLWTATAAPNDYIELGTSSEALGCLGHVDMLNRFFRNDMNTSDTKGRMYGASKGWRFKGHAESAFWRWACSWVRACRKPSDLGFDDTEFVLPRLIERDHIIETKSAPPGKLFAVPAQNFYEEREERRRTIQERCERVAALVGDTGAPFVIWCHLNDEGAMLERLIPGARQVSGADSDEAKEEAYEAFASGQVRGIITKPKIGAWGLNWQHCAHVVTFASHSYEQYYQSVRRCWRFGQKKEVVVDLVATEGERGVKDNLRRKALAADKMFTALVEHMNDTLKTAPTADYSRAVEVPSWL